MEVLKRATIALYLVITLLVSTTVNAGQLDDILNSSSGGFDFTGVSSIKTQTRGYYNFGGMAVRHDLGGSIRPFNITMPHLASGCGGVDIGFGGFSFLGIDKLVEKLQKIASAAPAFVFNMALSALCKDCQSIMDQLNAVADSINGLNFDACKSAVGWGKSIGNTLNAKLDTKDDAQTGINSVISDLSGSIKSATANLQAVINCGPGGECTDTSSAAAKAKALEKLKFQGSLIRKVFNDNQTFLSATTNGSDSTSTYAYWFSGMTQQDAEDFFRNMIGDYYGYVDESSCGGTDEDGGQKNYLVAIIPPKMSAEEVVKIMLGEDNGGQGQLMGVSLVSETVACDTHKGKPEYETNPHALASNIKAKTMRKSVEDRLLNVLSSMSTQNNNALKNDAKFISSIRYPVYKALNVASITNDTLLVSYIADVVVAQELVGLINELMRKGRTAVALIGQTESTKLLESGEYRAIEDRIIAINRSAAEIRDLTMKKMQDRVAQILAIDDISKRYKQELVKKGMYRLGH